ncbi:Thioredoxin reductase [Geodermatophilus telluris]|uniref:Thioredoxin reductase n=1 Tax=Geodermatophilus telluris TaxID=1190417 RepID=A0A1G6QAG1_9ACTN|nr:bifunctional NAD(P)/FAD-dependent oxidoreductase/class I SAM-dependent methyltransferase [Geodermatophilus telluris]SDC89492.1 Thioredoxin reductase [Geodermatophilus telluris]
MDETYDVVVVGGGAAGLSGALALGRARRSVAVVDDGTPRNAPAHEMHNYLGRDGTPPGELLAAGRAEVAGYGGVLVEDTVTAVGGTAGAFTVELAGGRVLGARRLLVTTGLTDELPEIPGVRELWGTDVLHCPYCHGWEVRDQPVGVLATGPMSLHQAQLWRQWSADVVFFLHTAPELDDATAEALAARGVRVVRGEVAALETDGGRLTGVRLAGGEVVPRAAVVVAPRFTARSAVLAGLGLEPEPFRMGDAVVGSHVPVDPRGATAVPGVWAAGNVADPGAQVIGAAAAGLLAGAAVNADLVAEDTRAAVEVLRAQSDPEYGEQWWEERYRSHGDGVWSGRVNDVLATEAADLPPGRALDAGAGEGGDAVWLARRGWAVTALDLSRTALDRAAAAAGAAGLTLDTRKADVSSWQPGEERWDLVTASFLHFPPATRDDVLRTLASAVTPGGTLLVTMHDGSDVSHGVQRPGLPEWYATGAQLAAVLEPAEWEVQVAESRPRQARVHEAHGHGDHVHVADAVLRARRRQPSSGSAV